MTRWVVLLKFVLATIVVALVAVQVLVLPVTARTYAAQYPEYAWLRVPLLVLAIVTLAVVEFGLLGVWRLLTLVGRGVLFSSPAADRWVVCEIGAVGLVAVLGGFMLALVDQPMVIILFPIDVLGGAAAVLLVVVLRGLLRDASRQCRELELVV